MWGGGIKTMAITLHPKKVISLIAIRNKVYCRLEGAFFPIMIGTKMVIYTSCTLLR